MKIDENQTENMPNNNGKNKRKVKVFSRSKKTKRAHKASGDMDMYRYQRKFPNLEWTDLFNAQIEAEKHCSKSYCVSSEAPPTTLPSSEKMFTEDCWKIPEFEELKQKLNEVKHRLVNYDIKKWQSHTAKVNPAQKIMSNVRDVANPTLLTQAWLKFYEIVNLYELVPGHILESDEEIPYITVHLCEAPGGFVSALNHYLALNGKNVKLDWTANSLNPHYEGFCASSCSTDDRLILQSYKNWFFGKNQTGDLMSKDFLDQLKKHINENEPLVHLVTADGSFDCQEAPENQEFDTHLLQLCEIIAALTLLLEGGSLVFKMFTIFECNSINLLYLVSCYFEELHVYKPSTSKLGNSEVYIIAKNFNGINTNNQDVFKIITEYFESIDQTKSMFIKDDIPSSFIEKMLDCSMFFTNKQINAIERNVVTYEGISTKERDFMEVVKFIVNDSFFKKNRCIEIENEKKLTTIPLDWDKNIVLNVAPIKWGGRIDQLSHEDRKNFLKEEFLGIFDNFKPVLMNFNNADSVGPYIKVKVTNEDKSIIKLTHCKPFGLIGISRFCCSKLFQIFLNCFWEDNCPVCKSVTSFYKHVKNCKIFENIDILYNDERTETTRFIPTDDFVNDCDVNNAIMVKTAGIGPYIGTCVSLNAVINLIENKCITSEEQVVLSNVQLLTQYQVGSFFLMSQLFKEICFYVSPNSYEHEPFIVLKGIISVNQAFDAVKSFKKKWWNANGSYSGTISIINIRVLLESPLHQHICAYNNALLFYKINKLLNKTK